MKVSFERVQFEALQTDAWAKHSSVSSSACCDARVSSLRQVCNTLFARRPSGRDIVDVGIVVQICRMPQSVTREIRNRF